MCLGLGGGGCVKGRAGCVVGWLWVILSVWYAAQMVWNLLPVATRVRMSGNKKVLCVPETGQCLSPVQGAALLSLTHITDRHRNTGARSTGLFLLKTREKERKKKMQTNNRFL